MVSKNILFVDDDVILVETSIKILAIWGHLAEPAYNGEEAINKTRTGKYDLLILDINLPDMSGFEVVKRIRAFNKKIGIVLITGYPELKDAIDTLDYDLFEILLKPITPKELVRVCDDYTPFIVESLMRARAPLQILK